ncbi:Uma2 family endonuclease [Gammaproteobacteria bacterium]
MSLSSRRADYISEKDYLEGEKVSRVKHEYVDGQVYAMAGASKNHQRIITLLSRRLSECFDNTSCEVFTSDIKIHVDGKYFYPDVVVVCDPDGDDDPYFTKSPRMIVEVLSGSTRKQDRTFKRYIYQIIPSLEEYVLIEQDFVQIELCRKSENWMPGFYFLGDDITFASVGLTLPVAEIYQRVENDDMRAFYAGGRCLSSVGNE